MIVTLGTIQPDAHQTAGDRAGVIRRRPADRLVQRPPAGQRRVDQFRRDRVDVPPIAERLVQPIPQRRGGHPGLGRSRSEPGGPKVGQPRRRFRRPALGVSLRCIAQLPNQTTSVRTVGHERVDLGHRGAATQPVQRHPPQKRMRVTTIGRPPGRHGPPINHLRHAVGHRAVFTGRRSVNDDRPVEVDLPGEQCLRNTRGDQHNHDGGANQRSTHTRTSSPTKRS